MGGACPTHAIASIYTGNYTTSADANWTQVDHKRDQRLRIFRLQRLGGAQVSGTPCLEFSCIFPFYISGVGPRPGGRAASMTMR
jgi:hypothetical protein